MTDWRATGTFQGLKHVKSVWLLTIAPPGSQNKYIETMGREGGGGCRPVISQNILERREVATKASVSHLPHVLG